MKSKQHIVAKAHEHPELRQMSVADLSVFIGVSEPVIYKWRRQARISAAACADQQATVDSVRREWEKKYAALNKQYEWLSDRLVEMAKSADNHRNNESDLLLEIKYLNDKINNTEKKSWIQRLFSSKV